MIAASRRWANVRPWQVFSRADSSSLVNTGTSLSLTVGGAQPGHGVRELFLFGEPAEELLEGPGLVAGVGVAVAGQQVHQPPLHVMAGYLVPPGVAGAGIRWAAANQATASVKVRTVLGALSSATDGVNQGPGNGGGQVPGDRHDPRDDLLEGIRLSANFPAMTLLILSSRIWLPG